MNQQIDYGKGELKMKNITGRMKNVVGWALICSPLIISIAIIIPLAIKNGFLGDMILGTLVVMGVIGLMLLGVRLIND